MRGSGSYSDTVKAIRDRINPKEFENAHFNRSQKGDLLIRFKNSQSVEDEIRRMREKLVGTGPEIQNVISLGRLDRFLIIDIDPSITETELLETLKTLAPEKLRDTVRINGFWHTSSGHAKAVVSAPRGVFTKINRIKVGFFLCRIQHKTPPPPRCYKCHGFGHYSKTCEGPNLNGTCRRCAGGHPTIDCTMGNDRCVACERGGIPPRPHRPGSAQCGARTMGGGGVPPPGDPLDLRDGLPTAPSRI